MKSRSVCVFLLLLTSLISAQPKLVITFFGSRTCGECAEIKERILQPLSKELEKNVEIKIYDSEDDFNLMMEFEKRFDVQQPAPQELFFPDTFLTGYKDIMASGEKMIRLYAADPSKWKAKSETAPLAKNDKKSELKKRLTFLYVTTGGLIDGINPCAIATMVFFISVLSLQKRSRREILIIGGAFTLAVYITYLLLGLGLLTVVTSLNHYHLASKIIRWGTVLFAGTVGILSFADAFKFNKSKDTKDIKLQLPKAVKTQIHKIISGNIGKGGLFFGTITAGFLVTLFEAVCTGQVYIPIIASLSEPGMRGIGIAYLIYYNFLFVVPLLVVMILTYYGLKWNKLASLTQKHLSKIKISIGTLLIFLAVYMVFWG